MGTQGHLLYPVASGISNLGLLAALPAHRVAGSTSCPKGRLEEMLNRNLRGNVMDSSFIIELLLYIRTIHDQSLGRQVKKFPSLFNTTPCVVALASVLSAIPTEILA